MIRSGTRFSYSVGLVKPDTLDDKDAAHIGTMVHQFFFILAWRAILAGLTRSRQVSPHLARIFLQSFGQTCHQTAAQIHTESMRKHKSQRKVWRRWGIRKYHAERKRIIGFGWKVLESYPGGPDVTSRSRCVMPAVCQHGVPIATFQRYAN